MKKTLVVIPVYISCDLHLEFTAKTVTSIARANHTNHTHKTLVVINRCDNKFLVELDALPIDVILENPINGVAKAWNMGIRYGLDNGFDTIMVTNNDIVFHQQAFDNLNTFIDQHPDFALWTMAEWKGASGVEVRTAIQNNLKDVAVGDSYDEHPHLSAFAVTPKSIQTLADLERGTKEPFPGLFDENFQPAYFEDGDIHQRIIIHKLHVGHTASALFYHYGSRTIKVDAELDRTNGLTYEKNRRYFEKKWGWDPHGIVVENDDPRRFTFTRPFNE